MNKYLKNDKGLLAELSFCGLSCAFFLFFICPSFAQTTYQHVTTQIQLPVELIAGNPPCYTSSGPSIDLIPMNDPCANAQGVATKIPSPIPGLEFKGLYSQQSFNVSSSEASSVTDLNLMVHNLSYENKGVVVITNSAGQTIIELNNKSRVSPSDFDNYYTRNSITASYTSTDIYNYLIAQGYLDSNGYVLDKFRLLAINPPLNFLNNTQFSGQQQDIYTVMLQAHITADIDRFAKQYGGIGGAVPVMTINVPLSTGVLQPGNNTITFIFNMVPSEGLSIGYRVLKYNFIKNDGTNLFSDSEFTWFDPANPSTNTAVLPPDISSVTSSDLTGSGCSNPNPTMDSIIACGKHLWMTGQLNPNVNDPNNKGKLMQARCTMCHFTSGKDLAFFNFSNNSIIERSKFHGLSQNQGTMIAAYIRNLMDPNDIKGTGGIDKGRAWNPVAQPGVSPMDHTMGVGDSDIYTWLAGAGTIGIINADPLSPGVLKKDKDAIPYIYKYDAYKISAPSAIPILPSHAQQVLPAGVTDTNLKVRDIPVAFQFLDWYQWLPRVHPVDAFGPDVGVTVKSIDDNGHVTFATSQSFDNNSWQQDVQNNLINSQSSSEFVSNSLQTAVSSGNDYFVTNSSYSQDRNNSFVNQVSWLTGSIGSINGDYLREGGYANGSSDPGDPVSRQETTNLYSAFLWLDVKNAQFMLDDDPNLLVYGQKIYGSAAFGPLTNPFYFKPEDRTWFTPSFWSTAPTEDGAGNEVSASIPRGNSPIAFPPRWDSRNETTLYIQSIWTYYALALNPGNKVGSDPIGAYLLGVPIGGAGHMGDHEPMREFIRSIKLLQEGDFPGVRYDGADPACNTGICTNDTRRWDLSHALQGFAVLGSEPSVFGQNPYSTDSNGHGTRFNGQVDKSDFAGLGLNLDNLWADLVTNGYIDDLGEIQWAFQALADNSTIPPTFSPMMLNDPNDMAQEQAISKIIQQQTYTDPLIKQIEQTGLDIWADKLSTYHPVDFIPNANNGGGDDRYTPTYLQRYTMSNNPPGSWTDDMGSTTYNTYNGINPFYDAMDVHNVLMSTVSEEFTGYSGNYGLDTNNIVNAAEQLFLDPVSTDTNLQANVNNSNDAAYSALYGYGDTPLNVLQKADWEKFRTSSSKPIDLDPATAFQVCSIPQAGDQPMITLQPVNSRVGDRFPGVYGSASFTATATGSTPLNYQWYQCAGNVTPGISSSVPGNCSPITGARGASLTSPATISWTTAPLSNNDDGSAQYVLAVTNSTCQVAISNGAFAEIEAQIVTPPSSVTVNVGGDATFTVVASGSAQISYQWYKDWFGTKLNLPDCSTGPSCTIHHVQASDAGGYMVQVQNNYLGVVSANGGNFAILTVQSGPVAPSAPSSLTATASPGQVNLSWPPSANADFYTVERSINNGPPYQSIVPSGATVKGTSFSDTQVTGGTAYYYVVQAVNSAGSSPNSIQTSVVAMPSNVAPVITTGLQPLTVTAGTTNPVIFSVSATGTPSPGFQWQLNGINISGTTGASYTVPESVTANSGSYTYSVIASNVAGNTNSSATLTVNPAISNPEPANNNTPAPTTYTVEAIDNDGAGTTSIIKVFNPQNPTPCPVMTEHSVTCVPGTQVTYKAIPTAPGHSFSSWGGNARGITDTQTVTIYSSGWSAVANFGIPPVVNVGSNQTVNLSSGAKLNGDYYYGWRTSTAGGAGITWSKVSGPVGGVVSFGDVNQPITTAAFSTTGTYVLQLTVVGNQSALTGSNQVTINVIPDPVSVAPTTASSSTITSSTVAPTVGNSKVSTVVTSAPSFPGQSTLSSNSVDTPSTPSTDTTGFVGTGS